MKMRDRRRHFHARFWYDGFFVVERWYDDRQYRYPRWR